MLKVHLIFTDSRSRMTRKVDQKYPEIEAKKSKRKSLSRLSKIYLLKAFILFRFSPKELDIVFIRILSAFLSELCFFVLKLWVHLTEENGKLEGLFMFERKKTKILSILVNIS